MKADQTSTVQVVESEAMNKALPLMESFYTVQGEGGFTGVPAYFIRLAGCDVGCHWCDVKESWDASKHPTQSLAAMTASALESGAGIVVVTGGEPAMYQLDALTQNLQNAGLRTHIETSGAHPLTGFWHWVCFSPKKFKQPVEEVYEKAHELKVVIYHKKDFEWAEMHAAKVNDNCQLFLQPEWSKRDSVMPLIVDYVKRHPQWRISLQTHKYMDIP